jgi:hypothetical protein
MAKQIELKLLQGCAKPVVDIDGIPALIVKLNGKDIHERM